MHDTSGLSQKNYKVGTHKAIDIGWYYNFTCKISGFNPKYFGFFITATLTRICFKISGFYPKYFEFFITVLSSGTIFCTIQNCKIPLTFSWPWYFRWVFSNSLTDTLTHWVWCTFILYVVRLYCSFIKLCYSDASIPERNQHTALDSWENSLRNWVPFQQSWN